MADKLNAREIAAKGDEIYQRKYRAEFEQRYRGRFAAIDLATESAYLGDLPEEALGAAEAAAPSGTFYLIRIGSLGVFKISRRFHADNHRLI